MLKKHRYILLIGSKKENKEILKTLKHPILKNPKRAREVSRVETSVFQIERTGSIPVPRTKHN